MTADIAIGSAIPSVSLEWRDFSEVTLPPILRVACQLFTKHGYHGVSIRAIARGANLSVPGLYHHYASKQAILDGLVSHSIGLMLDHTRVAYLAAGEAVAVRFNNVVECLLRFHMSRRNEAFVASTEMRSMDPDVFDRHVAQRDQQQQMLTEIIEQGIREGLFKCAHVHEASRALASLCVSVSSWYRPEGLLSVDELVQRYLVIARRIVGMRDEDDDVGVTGHHPPLTLPTPPMAAPRA